MFKLAINAGHWNGTTRGVPASLSPADHPNEWVLNDRVVRAVMKRLAAYDGIEVRRIDDPTGVTFVEDADRMRKANAWPADFYLAVHHNGGIGGGTGGGIVAYTDPRPTENEVAWQKALYDALIAHTGLRGNRAAPLAKADLFECRETAMDAVLLELGFMDSKTDIKSILAADWPDKCAAAIAEVIVRRARLTKKQVGLKKGDKGLGVYALKKLLALAGLLDVTLPCALADNGDFGDGTERDLKALEALTARPQDGVADQADLAAVFALLKKRIGSLRDRNTTLAFQYDRMKAQIKELQNRLKK